MQNRLSEIGVSRIHRLEGEGKVKAFVDLVFCGGFIVKGIKVVEANKKIFVSMPATQGKDGKWYDLAYPATDELKSEIEKLVLSAYRC